MALFVRKRFRVGSADRSTKRLKHKTVSYLSNNGLNVVLLTVNLHLLLELADVVLLHPSLTMNPSGANNNWLFNGVSQRLRNNLWAYKHLSIPWANCSRR